MLRKTRREPEQHQDPFERLALAVLEKAARDDDKRFFRSVWARRLMLFCGLDYEAWMEQYKHKRLVKTGRGNSCYEWQERREPLK